MLSTRTLMISGRIITPNEVRYSVTVERCSYLLWFEGRINTKSREYGKYDAFKAFALLLDCIYLTDENALVNGTVSLIDFGGYTMSHQTFMSVEDRRDFMHTWQVGILSKWGLRQGINTFPFYLSFRDYLNDALFNSMWSTITLEPLWVWHMK